MQVGLSYYVSTKNLTGEACWWTIHPASKQRSEGEKVRVGDDVILVSVATERYLVRKLWIRWHRNSAHGLQQRIHGDSFLPPDPLEYSVCQLGKHEDKKYGWVRLQMMWESKVQVFYLVTMCSDYFTVTTSALQFRRTGVNIRSTSEYQFLPTIQPFYVTMTVF